MASRAPFTLLGEPFPSLEELTEMEHEARYAQSGPLAQMYRPSPLLCDEQSYEDRLRAQARLREFLGGLPDEPVE